MEPQQEQREFVTTKEIAERVGVSVQTVRNWIREGRLPAVRFADRFRVRRSDFEAMLAARTTHAELPQGSPYESATVVSTIGPKRSSKG